MKHLGDITQLHGDKVPVVDVICGGSPCQDLSVAGKRAGLAGERSGLFMDQIRIIKEMRENDRRNGRADQFIRPRFMVWENVPGAFSSNKGEDFRAVLEETAKVADKDAVIPGPPNGKWSHAGCIVGDGWSIAWRVHDAQYWGVPQRRKRICLLADFNGGAQDRYCLNCSETPMGFYESRLSWILERNPDPKYKLSQKACLGILRRAEKRGKILPPMLDQALRNQAGLSVSKSELENQGGGKGILIQNERTGALSTLNNQSVCAFEPGAASRVGGHVYDDDIAGTVRANAGDNQQAVVYGISSDGSNAMRSDNPHSGIYVAETSRTLDLNGGSPACNQGGMAVVQSAGFDGYNQTVDEELAQPLRAADGGDSTPKVVCLEGNGSRPSHMVDCYVESDTMYTLNSTEHHAVCIENHPADSRVKVSEDGIVQTLSSRMGTGGGNVPMVMEPTVFPETAAARCAQDGRGAVHSQMMSDPEGNFVLEPVTASKASYFTSAHNDEVAETLVATDYKDPQLIAYGLDRASFNQGQNAKFDFSIEEEKVGSLTSRGPGGVLPCASVDCLNGRETAVNGTLAANARKSLNSGNVCRINSIVRRLTPLECERLQGFPDNHTNIGDWVDSKGKKHKGDSDSPRYKALGNSIALPYWAWMAERMVKYLPENPTMASLFDGIGGFPLVFSRVGCKPVWASEIEEFPIAVTKIRFPE